MKRLLWSFPILFLLISCSPDKDTKPASQESADQPGKQRMEQYCGTCHALPSPSDLDQKTWKNHILIRMGAYMGIYNDNVQYYDSVPSKWLEPGIGGQRVLANGIYPSQPMMNRPDWESLRDYILKNAPSITTGPSNLLPITTDLDRFEVHRIQPDPSLQPAVSAVHIDTVRHSLLAAFFQQSLYELSPQGKRRAQVDGIYGPVFLEHSPAGYTMAQIGSMRGSDHPKGSVVQAASISSLKSGTATARFDSLMRPVMCRWSDLDADGDQDAVIAQFGYHLGELGWEENMGGGRYSHHTIFPDDGSVSIFVGNLVGDALPDILSLQANADERLDLYVNKGKGQFERQNLFRFNPTYGNAAMEVVDWEKDGDLDILIANGDNGDYPPILKPNHGIHLFLNEGGKWHEAVHLGLNGAYGLRARDYDADGDLDIAAVSFYPDFASRPQESFVYFQQDAPLKFSAHTFPEVGLGRWMVMDAGDIDNDGDQDIALGAFDVKSDDCSDATYNQWLTDNVPIILLINKTK